MWGWLACYTLRGRLRALRGHRGAAHAGYSGLGARCKPYLPTCYTSMVHGSEAKLGRANGLDLDSNAIEAVCGDGVHVIPCGVACRLSLRCHRGLRIRKAPMDEGMVALCCFCLPCRTPLQRGLRLRKPSLLGHFPARVYQPRAVRLGGTLVHIYRVVSGECSSVKRPPLHTGSCQAS